MKYRVSNKDRLAPRNDDFPKAFIYFLSLCDTVRDVMKYEFYTQYLLFYVLLLVIVLIGKKLRNLFRLNVVLFRSGAIFVEHPHIYCGVSC